MVQPLSPARCVAVFCRLADFAALDEMMQGTGTNPARGDPTSARACVDLSCTSHMMTLRSRDKTDYHLACTKMRCYFKSQDVIQADLGA